MGERRGMKALELWCKRVTDGYEEVKVENMTTSWRDGLAFCAIIHHFRPDLIDFGSLNKKDIYRNNELAFRTAEMHLGIPALLDAEDMVECSMPDRLSILTYLSQFYQTFAGSRQSTSPNRTPPGGKRSASPSVRSPSTQTPPTKMAMLGQSRREPCTKCQLPVFIAERLLVGGRTLYHRTCFRCARCQHQLSVANCYETEDGQYCCETCPDEVEQEKDNTDNVIDTHSISSEKNDTYSADFESVLESEKSYSLDNSVLAQDIASSKARTDFMIGQLQWTEEEVINSYPDLPVANSCVEATDKEELGSIQSTEALDCSHVNIEANVEAPHISDNSNSVEISTYFSTKTNSQPGEDTQKVVEQVPSINSFKLSDSYNQPLTANDRPKDCLNDQNNLVTQCTKEPDTSSTSIVKMRMKMFDNSFSSSPERVASKIDFDQASCLSRSKAESVIDVPGHETVAQSSGVTTYTSSSSRNKLSVKQLEETESVIDVPGHETVAQPSDLTTYTNLSSRNKLSVKQLEETESELSSKLYMDQTMDESAEKEAVSDESLATVSNEEVQEEQMTTDVPGKVGVDLHSVTLESEDRDLHVAYSSDLNPVESIDLVVQNSNGEVKEEYPVEDTSEEKTVQAVNTDIHLVEKNLEEKENKSQFQAVDKYPTDLNPFGEDDEEEETTVKCLGSANKSSTNPFGTSDDEGENVPSLKPRKPPRPPQPQIRQSLTLGSNDCRVSPVPKTTLTLDSKKVVEAPNLSLNPFWSKGEEPSTDEELQPKRTPIPLPRFSKNVASQEPSPLPRLNRSSGQFGSGTSLSSTGSSANSTLRLKKKPAPPPPLPPVSTHPGLTTPSEFPTPPHSITSSPRTRPRQRKTRPAPPPPDPALGSKYLEGDSSNEIECEREKNEKDEENRTRQTRRLIKPTEEQSKAMIAPNKSTFGQWKRKKGPAPPRPVPPQRREIKVMPMKEVKRELDDIEVQQVELERQGVSLEKIIRSKFEQTSTTDEAGVTPAEEDLVLQLFEIVNEKNELFRRQAELMYLRRQHRLEEEHADLEYEIRCLLMRPEHTKTDTDKAYEEELIQRLVDVVERRNEIVNSLEMDRRREVEEDLSIHQHLASFAAKGKGDTNALDENVEGSTTLRAHKKTLKLLKKRVKKNKEKPFKKSEKDVVDSDKDVDESDSAAKLSKEKKPKKKWF